MTDKVQKIREEVERLQIELIQEKEKGYGSDADDACILELQNVLTYIDSMQEEPQVKESAKVQHINETCKESVNSLTQESVSEDFEKIVEEIAEPTILNAYGTKELARRLRNTICNTSVSEDLEEAANEWNSKALFNPFYMALDDNGRPNGVRRNYTTHAKSFKAGAKWQKAKDESITEDLGEYINELSKQFPEVSFAKLSRIAVRVAQWQKEQMIAKAIDGEILEIEDNDCAMCSHTHLELFIEPDTLEKNCFKDNDKVKVIVIKED